MSSLNLSIEGVSKPQVAELLADLSAIEGVSAEYFKSPTEVKEFLTVTITLNFDANINLLSSGTIIALAYCIKKFFDKEKAKDNEPIIIQLNYVEIKQGETQEEISQKLKQRIEKTK